MTLDNPVPNRTIRRPVLCILMTVIVVLPAVTVWLLLPALHDPCIREALDQSTGPSFWWPPSWREELNVLKKLREPVTVDLVETPFADAADFWSRYLGVPIELDEPTLMREAVGGGPTVTICVQAISLASALKLILDDRDAKCRIERGTIRVTHREPGEATLPKLAAVPAGSPAEQRLHNKLQDPIKLHFDATPFDDVVTFLQDSLSINIVVDWRGLETSGLTRDSPLTIRTKAVPLKDTLLATLEPFHATFRVQDEVLFFTAQTERREFDVIIRNGTIYDGSGSSPVRSDVGIRGDRIAAVGELANESARLVVDAHGHAVAPGFINMLSWSNESLIADGHSQGEIRQGVTTQIMGEGDSMGPLSDEMKRRWKAEHTSIQYDYDWTTLCEYLLWLERRGVSQNVASFIGATTIREHVIGLADRIATPAELERMRELVEREMKDGALGIASSLVYAPAFYASTEELIELCKVAARYQGKYISHMRSEGADLLGGIDELIRISREAQIPAEIYHFKAAGQPNWSKMDAAIEKVENARRDGLRITADMYCYTAGSTGLNASIPPWAHDGGQQALRKRLRDPETRQQIAQEIRHRSDGWENFYLGAGSPDRILLVDFAKPHLKPLQGKTLAQVAAERSRDPVETLMDLVIEDESRIGTVYFMMSEENVRKLLRLPWVSFGSDAASQAPEGVFLKSATHPRAYGNFARLLGKYARDEKLLSLEEAIRKMTSLPAENLGLDRRGRLRTGYFADIVVFDSDTIIDHATYENPHQYATGVEHVFVNGVQVIRNGEHTGAKPGRALWGPGKSAN